MNSLFHNFWWGLIFQFPCLLSEAPAKSVHYTYNLNIENSINHQNYELDYNLDRCQLLSILLRDVVIYSFMFLISSVGKVLVTMGA